MTILPHDCHVHSPLDQALVDLALSIGCLAPTFSRETDPAAWRAWEKAVSQAIALARVCQERSAELSASRVAADALSGHPTTGPVETKPMFVMPFDAMAPLAAMFAEVV